MRTEYYKILQCGLGLGLGLDFRRGVSVYLFMLQTLSIADSMAWQNFGIQVFKKLKNVLSSGSCPFKTPVLYVSKDHQAKKQLGYMIGYSPLTERF